MTAQTHRETNRIVVGMDLTENGDDALREAMRLARRIPGSELHAVYVIATHATLHDAKRLEKLSAELHARIVQLGARVSAIRVEDTEALSAESITLYIRLGDPAQALHQVAVDIDADLIVVSSHGRRGVDRLIQGSVAESLIRMARVPVCVAHPKDFSELKRSDSAEPARAGADLHALGLTERMHPSFPPRSWHISGLL